jgi:hypothetical protein
MVNMSAHTPDLDRTRTEFFRRTRRVTGCLYAFLGIASAGLLAGGIATEATPALLAFIAATVFGVSLFVLSARIPTSAKTARALLWLAPGVGVLAASRLDLDLSTPVILGGMAGFCAGAAIGIAMIRRRLAHDDDLLRRQQRLGFDPERPWAWLRSSTEK